MADDEDLVARLRATGQAAFSRAMRTAAHDVRSVGDSAGAGAGMTRRFDRAAGMAGSTLLGVARAASMAGGALAVGLGAGVVAGVKFDASMETLETAFANFLGSTQKARTYLQGLYKISARTPFEFPELAGAARRFLAFGFSAKETTRLLNVMGDTVAGIGGGAPEIDRLVMSLGQIQAKGKLSTEELMQMAELGVPAFAILRKELGLTGSELDSKLRKGAIDADTAIRALSKGMSERFGGSSAAQAKTFAGQLSTAKDNAMQFAGTLAQPVFDALRTKVLPASNRVLASLQSWAKAGGPASLAAAFRQGAGGGPQAPLLGIAGAAQTAGRAFRAMVAWGRTAGRTLLEAFRPALPFFQNVAGPLLLGFAKGVLGSVVLAVRVVVPIVKVLATGLGWLGTMARPLRGVFEGIGTVLGFVLAGPVLRALGTLPKLGLVFRAAAVPIRFLGAIVGAVGRTLVATFMPAIEVAVGAAIRFGRTVRAVAGTIRAGLAAWIGAYRAAMTSIIGAIRGAITGVRGAAGAVLRAGLAVFRGAAQLFVGVGRAMVQGIARGIVAAPGALADALRGVLRSAVDSLPGAVKEAAGAALGILPGFARGGTASRSGPRLVGERGPEVVNLRAGDTVTPNRALARLGAPARLAGRGAVLEVHVTTELDRRRVGSGIARIIADDFARA